MNSGFEDEAYVKVGAKMVDTAEEVYATADMIVKVKEPFANELSMIRPDQIVFTYFHFAASETLTRGFIETGAIAIAYETVQAPDGSLPLLIPMSEVAGRMATQEGARLLERPKGGRGVLPAIVMILGAGVVGTHAATIAAGMGAQVYLLDVNMTRLRYLSEIMPPNVITVYSNTHHIVEILPKVDLLIGAVLIVGAKTPTLITRPMLSLMKKGSVIIDVSVDQGGCVETSKPTTHEHPTFVVDGVLHYGVTNMPGAVPFTSTIALTNVTLPYVLEIADKGFEQAFAKSKAIQTGINIYKGKVTHRNVAGAFDLEYTPVTRI